MIIQRHCHVECCLLGPIFSLNGEEETRLVFWVGNFILKSSSPSMGLFLYQVKPSSKGVTKIGITKIGPALNHCHMQALIWVMPSPEGFTLHITSIILQHKTFEITYKVWWWPWKTRVWKPLVNSMYFSEQRSDKDNSTQILTFSAYIRFIKKLQIPMHRYRWSWFHSSSAPNQNKGFWGPLSLLQYSGVTAVFEV